MGLRDMFRREPTTRVQMTVSVDTDHVAGESYDVPVEVADRYIARGYATGTMSREYDEHELPALRGNPQTVTFGG